MSNEIVEFSWYRPAGRPAWLPDAANTNPAAEAAWRQRLIRDAAYFRSLRHPPGPGRQLEDWLAAEKEIDARLASDCGGSAEPGIHPG